MQLSSFSALLLLFMAGLGSAESLHGHVVDAKTGRPIEGAVVLVVWSKAIGFSGSGRREIVEIKEVETDAQGGFALEKPSGSFRQDDEMLIVYKFGYVVWNNLELFQPGERPPWYQPRHDTGVPSQILLEEFPPGGNRARHMWYINAVGEMVGGWERIPKFWSAIQREIAEAQKQCQPNCD